jgi:cell division initiation protein
MDLSARNIHEKQFHDAWRGYNQEEVDDFLDRVAESLDRIQRENVSLQNRIRELDQAVSTSRDTEEMLKKTLVSAQKASEEAIASAKAKAEQLITEAEARVTRTNEEARGRMTALEDDLRRKSLDADREHASKKRELEASIERLKSHETELKQRLRTFLEQQLKALEILMEDRSRGAARLETAANATVTPSVTPGSDRPAVSRPVSTEATPPGHLTARPSATPSPAPGGRHENAAGRQDEEGEAAAESGAPRRGLRGLFWGDES